MIRTYALSSVVTLLGLGMAGSSPAALTFYSTQPAFAAATTATAVDTFDSLTNRLPSSPLQRSVGTYGYTAGESPLYPYFATGVAASNHWLAEGSVNDTMTLAGFRGSPQAIGADFFGSVYVETPTGFYPDQIAGSANLAITVTDSLGAKLTTILANATPSTFAGFVSNGTITSLTLANTLPDSGYWASIDNLTLGAAAVTAVPEPADWVLLAAGLGVLALAGRRAVR